MDSLKYLMIVLKSKINKKLQKRYYIFDDNYENMAIKRFGDLNLADYSDKIYIIIDRNMAREKNILMKIIKRLIKQGKKIYLIEEVKVFNDEDIANLYQLSKNIIFFDKYMEMTKELARNQNLWVDISSYVLIIDKLNYFQKICEKYCRTDLDKLIFAMVQVSNYIKYGYLSIRNSCLASGFLLKTGVCMDIAICLWKCLDRLNIEASIIKGMGNINEIPELSSLVRADHAWNQVRINNNWYNIDLTWYMSSKKLDYVLVDDETFYKGNLHKVIYEQHYCRYIEDREYIQNKINEYNKYENIFKQYDEGNKQIELILKK